VIWLNNIINILLEIIIGKIFYKEEGRGHFMPAALIFLKIAISCSGIFTGDSKKIARIAALNYL